MPEAPMSMSGDLSIDMAVRIGSVELPNPVMTASGTAGYGTELRAYLDLAELGAVVTKSLSPFAWAGNPAPRVVGTPAGMLNAVGLQNPGAEAWLETELPRLRRTGARVVASIWGRTVADYEAAARTLADAGLTALEVNVSCPNLEGRGQMFACDPAATADAISAATAAGVPLWAKLTPNVTDLVEIAAAALTAGAEALTLINTVFGMSIDPVTAVPTLGNVGGGLSGPAIRPVAVRAIFDVRAALGEVPIVGVGGVAAAEHAVELMAAGACAIQVGTASFWDPRAPRKVVSELRRWCKKHGVFAAAELTGRAHHRRTGPSSAVKSRQESS
ncbi:dihydroorotate dehydrogenase [Candidatus Poriferisodalis sp.]|uniref:dihydroorotate dehydrogenase n=2 Tax=Candidatus Poriferisodalis sp. TaxID=3101277 RepID=UPI003B5B6BFE